MPQINLQFLPIKSLTLIVILILIVTLACGDTPATPDASVNSFSYSVRVLKEETNQSVSNATVTIEVSGLAPLQGVTDTNGFVRIFIDTSYVNKPARLLVVAHEYKPYRREIDLSTDTLPDTIPLKSILNEPTPDLAATTQTAQPTNTNTPKPKPTLEPSSTPDLPSTVLAVVATTLAAQPTSTPYPTYTPPPTLPTATPVVIIATTTPAPVPTEPNNMTSNTSLEVGEWWEENGVLLRVNDVEFGTDRINVSLEFHNKTGDTAIFKWSADGNFSLVDNTNHRYEPFSKQFQEVIEAGEKVEFRDNPFADYSIAYLDDYFFNSSVTDMIFTATDLSRISKAQWHIRVPK